MCGKNGIRVGLALGGGAFRGLAHIGVLDVLEKEGIEIHGIAGTSVGSLIGALYATGMPPREMAERTCALQEKQYYDITVPRMGLLQGKRLENLVRELTGEQEFSETRIPLSVVACDFEKMEPVYWREGKIYEAVRASISIPGIFIPVEKDGRMFVDGGLVNRIPGEAARVLGMDVVIGVDVGYRGYPRKPANLIEMVLYTFEAMEWQVSRQQSGMVDRMIVPQVQDIDPARLGNQAATAIERGREAMRKAAEDLKKLIGEAEKRKEKEAERKEI